MRFTPEQIEAFNRQQHSGQFHPFTCGGNRTDEHHLDGEGILVATADGLVCPYCQYRQPFSEWMLACLIPPNDNNNR